MWYNITQVLPGVCLKGNKVGVIALKIVICDDSREDMDLLSTYLLQYSEEFNYNFEITEFGSGEALLEILEREQYPIYFLDIYMTGITGVEVAEKIRSFDEDCKIIFTTYSQDHKGDGFDVHATHYLVKPVNYKGVCECMKRCKGMLNKDLRHLEVTVQRQALKIPIKDIYYIEAIRNGILISHKAGKVKCYETLANVSKKLNDSNFLTCHRGFIVNMSLVKTLDEDSFIMNNGDFVPIRQKGRTEIKAVFNNYILNRIWQE